MHSIQALRYKDLQKSIQDTDASKKQIENDNLSLKQQHTPINLLHAHPTFLYISMNIQTPTEVKYMSGADVKKPETREDIC